MWFERLSDGGCAGDHSVFGQHIVGLAFVQLQALVIKHHNTGKGATPTHDSTPSVKLYSAGGD